MSDEKWLWDQPHSWHAVNRALLDIDVLLNHLNELPDSRLLGYFEETKQRIVGGTTRSTAPPCDSYAKFLDRLHEVAAAFQTGCAPTEPAATSDGRTPLGPIAFVEWSRDFLAAVAAPATANSIRLTRDYAIHRARVGWLRRLVGHGGARRTASGDLLIPTLPPDPDERIHQRCARRLANGVRRFEFYTIAMVLVTVCISIYALSGRLILDNEKQTADAWDKLDAVVEDQEDRTFPALKVPVADKPGFPVTPFCDLVDEQPVRADKNRTQLAANADTPIPGASSTGGDNAKTSTRYLSARQDHLCDQRKKLTQRLFVVSTHLQFWSSVIAAPHDEIWRFPHYLIWRLFRLDVPSPISPAFLFGVQRNTLEQLAGEGNGAVCIAFESPAYRWTADECIRKLWELIDRSRNVAESILGSITQYILPVCYGFLGAMAAALRMIRRKVDACTLTPTDRARLQQGAILGVLCGAIIGLFANHVGGTDGAGALGLSALALIAGYNVDGVFRFFDELSDRVFGASKAR